MADAAAPYLVDTHAHLTWPVFDDVAAVVEHARLQGVSRILSAGVDSASSRDAVRLTSQYAAVYAAVGIHPNDLEHGGDASQIAPLLTAEKVVAVGETGLDYYRSPDSSSEQRRSFEAHLSLAEAYGKPVIIHNRDADSDVLALFRSVCGRVRGVLHCFSSAASVAEEALSLGLYLSFAGNLTYPSAAALREVAAWVPASHLLVETDAPFLSPVPYRGARNEPAHVGLTLGVLARCRNEDAADLATTIARNAHELFGW